MITYPMFKADPGFRNAFDGFTKVGETSATRRSQR